MPEGLMEAILMSMRSSGEKSGATLRRKLLWAIRVGVVVGRSFRKRRSLPGGICQNRRLLDEMQEMYGVRLSEQKTVALQKKRV